MRRLPAVVFSLGLIAAAPPPSDTLQLVTTRGIVISVNGNDIDVTYTPDGKLTAMGGAVTGAWRIDGDRLCTSSNFDPEERCVAYPRGKKAGDTFDLTTPQGTATVHIK